MKDNLTTNASNEAENPAFLVGAVQAKPSVSLRVAFGFKATYKTMIVSPFKTKKSWKNSIKNLWKHC